jgi:CelD/BcsL family acetyltransferase involved in cellulose biosynthesis
MNMILKKDRRAEALQALLKSIEDLSCDSIHFNQLPEASETTADILTWIQNRGMLQDLVPTPCPRRDIPESYDALLADLQARFRSSLRSSRRKLSEKYKVEFGLHDAPGEFSESLEALFRNHESRWKAKGQSGVFTDPKKRAFYELLVKELHAKGNLRFYFLKLDGEIKAQEFCFSHGRVVYLLQEGFDFAHASENIGNTLRGMVFEHLIAEKTEVYDFLAGMSRHKTLWGNTYPNDLRIQVAPQTWKGRLLFHTPRVVEGMKDVIKKLIRRNAAKPLGDGDAGSVKAETSETMPKRAEGDGTAPVASSNKPSGKKI